MKLTFLILSAAVCFNGVVTPARAGDNFSLWPRRPAELEQARRLIAEHKGSEAVYLLRPHWRAAGIAGQESRQLTALVNVPRYLSRQHPKAGLYTVRSGDNLPRIARNSGCPIELVMMLNGIVDPSKLRAGQKLAIVPMRQRMEIHLPLKEISVWDGDILVASYRFESVSGVEQQGENAVTRVKAREAYSQGGRVRSQMPGVAAADRAMTLENGILLTAEQRSSGAVIRMNQRDLNELVLLMDEEGEVQIVRDEKAYMQQSESGAAEQAESPSAHPTST